MDDKVELTEREKELIDKVSLLEQDKTNLVGELTELRKKKEPITEPKETPTPVVAPDPKEVVLSVLAEKEQEQVKANFELAKEELKRTVKELSPDVDAGGILFSKFERELSKFNMSGLKSKEDFLARFGEAFRLMTQTSSQPTKVNFYNGATQNNGTEVKADDGASLDVSEQKLIEQVGWTKEKYLATKAKKPAYVSSLLKYYR